MSVEFSLRVLKWKKEELLERKDSIEKGDGRWYTYQPDRDITRINHHVADLDFAIGVLETYLD